MYLKDFDKWTQLKKKINDRKNAPFAQQRDIWWCYFGVNVGAEEDGKNQLFERPVLIIKVLSKTTSRIVPLTSKIKEDSNHFAIKFGKRQGSAILSHMKTIDTKRLSRKLARLDTIQFNLVIERLKDTL